MRVCTNNLFDLTDEVVIASCSDDTFTAIRTAAWPASRQRS